MEPKNNGETQPGGVNNKLPEVTSYEKVSDFSNRLANYKRSDDEISKFGEFKLRQEGAGILAAEAAPALMQKRNDFDFMYKAYNGDWKQTVNDPAIVNLVKEDTAVQESILKNPTKETVSKGGIIIPDSYVSKKSQASLEAKSDLGIPLGNIGNPDVVHAEKKDEAVESTDYTDMAEGKPYTDGIPVSAQKPQEPPVVKPAPVVPIAVPQTPDNTPRITYEPKVTSPDQTNAPFDWRNSYGKIDQTVSDIPFRMIKEEKPTVPPITPPKPDFVRTKDPDIRPDSEEVKRRTAELLEKFKKGGEQMEKMERALDNRKKGSLERLSAMGLKGIKNGLEAWKNAKPGYKIALGLTLAGASVATGGITGVIQKSLSAVTYSTAYYDEKVKAKEAKGEKVEGGQYIIRSIGYGVLVAVGTSLLFSEIGDLIQSDTFSNVKDSIKEWFSSFGSPSPEAASSIAAVVPGVPTDPGILNGVPSLSDYTIEAGDNLTNIMKDEVLSKIPGAESFTDFQKENMIQNLLKIAGENKDIAFYDMINKFADPNLIHPGETLNLESVKAAFTEIPFADFNGETLLDHAKSLKQ